MHFLPSLIFFTLSLCFVGFFFFFGFWCVLCVCAVLGLMALHKSCIWPLRATVPIGCHTQTMWEHKPTEHSKDGVRELLLWLVFLSLLLLVIVDCIQPTAASHFRVFWHISIITVFHLRNVLFQRYHQFLWFLCSSWFNLRKSWAQSPNKAVTGSPKHFLWARWQSAVMGPALIARPIIHWLKRLFNIKLIYTNKFQQCLIIFKEVAFLEGCLHPDRLNSSVIKRLFFLMRAHWNVNEPMLLTIFKTL